MDSSLHEPDRAKKRQDISKNKGGGFGTDPYSDMDPNPVPVFIDSVFAKTSPKRSFSVF